MTERVILTGAALLLVVIAMAIMAGLHERHYKNRKWQMLESRLATLERIITGEHD